MTESEARPVTARQIAIAIVRHAFKDYEERESPHFTLLANVEAWLSDPDSWNEDDDEAPAADAHLVQGVAAGREGPR